MSNNKQSIKLYTEEQVREILKSTHIHTDNDVDMILPQFTPIELPSDEDIDAIAKDKIYLSNDCFGQYDFTSGKQDGFYEGAKWMRDKIQGGNNESN